MPSRKRSVPAKGSTASDRRRSGRLSGSAGKKSLYFEGSSDSEGEAPPAKKKRGRPSAKKAKDSEDESEDQYHEETEETAPDEVDTEEDEKGELEGDGESEEEEEEQVVTKKKRGRPAKKATPVAKKAATAKKPARAKKEASDDDDDEDDGVRKVEIIPLEKMRDTGGVAYEDHKVHKNTMLFLKDLKANNKRPWLKAHDGDYRRSLKDWQSFVETTTQTLIDIDETIPELPVKDVIFRIHRDIRFSKDPTPYKPYFSAAWSRTGRKGPYAVYYVHCEPAKSFVGGGLWCPEAQSVARLRQSIDARPARWRHVLTHPLFARVFFPSVEATGDGDDGDEAMVRAFVDKNQGNALKKKPMGYDITHRDIELLKLRNFTVGKSIDDDLFSQDDAQDKLKEIMTGLHEFVRFLNSVVMPDTNYDPSQNDSDEEEEQTEDE